MADGEREAPAAGNFDLFRFGRIGPFLTWDPAIPPAAPVGYIGDPAIPHAITGSPYGTNYFKVERQQPDGSYALYNYFTNQFTVAGKKAKSLAVSANPAGAFYTSPRSVDLTASDANATIYYTIDGSDPKTNPAKILYDTSISIPTTALLKFYAELPDGTQSDLMSEQYDIDTTPFSVLATPAGGLVVDSVQVTLSSVPSTRAGKIYYTKDGSSPLTSPTKILYTAPITFTSTTQITLRSVMVDISGTASPERTDIYSFTQSKPAVTPPVSNFVVNSRLTNTSVPVTTAWTSTAFGGRTIARHTATVANNGVNSNVPLSPVTRTDVTQTLASGRSYLYTVTARDSAGNISIPAPGTLFNLFAAQESTRGFGFQGGWTRIASPTFSSGFAMSATKAGIVATLTVAGSKFGWVSARGPTLGIATVSVDGGAPITVDLYSATSLPNSIVYVTPAMTAGTHVIRVSPTGTRNVRSTGNRVDVDAIVGF
ncbi:MAG: chitobiase/beta-hexosaminidase C-terminal domain-containing protein [Chloroflexi bacterium]|nr:chitobiase/beta-hexosaminidase C-terminal domain-containing protein [Chloroflexota bacterium]